MKNQINFLSQKVFIRPSFGVWGNLTLLCFILLFTECQQIAVPPPPTNGKINPHAEESEDNADAKEKWIALMHQSAPDIDWQRVEFQNRFERHRKRTTQTGNSRSDQEILANGKLVGEWNEIGSFNNAGSVLATEYDRQNDLIYLISAGGTFWRGNRNNDGWVPLNEDLQFQSRFLERISIPDDKFRFLALSGGIPMYSDDEGANWIKSNGITLRGNGSSDRAMMMKDSTNQIYLLSKRDYWTDLSLFTSTDSGQSYTRVHQFTSNNYNNFALLQPHFSSDFYVITKSNEDASILYKRNAQGQLEVIPNANFSFGLARANLQGIYDEIKDSLTLFAYGQSSVDGERITELYRSGDEGLTWERLSEIPTSPWQVGLFISPSDPNLMLVGAVECFRSVDGGLNWTKVNRWQDYYDDIVTQLHADMMVFNEFETADGLTFQLISNHGGLNISYDGVQSVTNIGLDGLNVGQFYDVQTDPIHSNWVYGGTQDQGFQRGEIMAPGQTIPMEQVWSGDYGHMAFTKDQTALWTVYPGGLIYRYNDPKNDPYPFSYYRLESENESVWIPPLIADPNPTEDVVYLAGGNPDGGPGSFIIQLSHTPWQIEAEKHSEFNFKDESGGGEVSALAYSKLNPNLWFAATTNGRFFYSTDRGKNWEQTLDFVPNGQYLYGASIHPSPLDENTVYFAGSGYSNPPVLVSKDGGITFSPLNEGLPPTLVIELTGDPEGQFLFAATESGPYVYSFSEEQWFDMAGEGAPAQTYWSVEYLPTLNKVRFGTYGRGIWDFDIQEVTVNTDKPVSEGPSFTIFPNPGNGQFTINYTFGKGEQLTFQVFDLSGKLIDQQKLNNNGEDKLQKDFNYTYLKSGIYIVVLSDGINTTKKKLIIT